ncbi:3-hydroxybenzoate 6-monooxygenase [Cupriavidus basilensis]
MGEAARKRSVFTDYLMMMDAIDATEVAKVDVGARYRERFGNPYAVIHRADIHLSILEAVQDHPLIQFRTATTVCALEQDERGVTVIDQHGERHRADAVIGCDGVKSAVRQALLGDEPRVTGHVVYRAVVDVADMPADLRINAPVVWAGPNCHLVHYPLRGGEQYNLVVTFHSREQEVWGVRDGSKEEVLSYFEGIHARPHQMLDRPTSWRRWATADRDPVERWSFGRATILGDAAHPMTQYLAQGACQALEDAVTLGAAVEASDGDFEGGLRAVREGAHPAHGTGPVLRPRDGPALPRQGRGAAGSPNSLWVGRTQEQILRRAAMAARLACRGLPWEGCGRAGYESRRKPEKA